MAVQPQYGEAEITEALMALIAWSGNASAAVRFLKGNGKTTPASGTLAEWSRTTHLERYNELRDKFREKLEDDLAHEMRDVARLAVQTERLAIDKARHRLEKNEDPDPGRTAANLARVAQSSTDKLMSLTGRPTTYTQDRTADEILRSLVQMGVLQPPAEESPPQIAEATVVKDSQ